MLSAEMGGALNVSGNRVGQFMHLFSLIQVVLYKSSIRVIGIITRYKFYNSLYCDLLIRGILGCLNLMSKYRVEDRKGNEMKKLATGKLVRF